MRTKDLEEPEGETKRPSNTPSAILSSSTHAVPTAYMPSAPHHPKNYTCAEIFSPSSDRLGTPGGCERGPCDYPHPQNAYLSQRPSEQSPSRVEHAACTFMGPVVWDPISVGSRLYNLSQLCGGHRLIVRHSAAHNSVKPATRTALCSSLLPHNQDLKLRFSGSLFARQASSLSPSPLQPGAVLRRALKNMGSSMPENSNARLQ